MQVGAALTVLFPLAIALYFVPTMIAAYRKANVGPVFLINLFTGWTTIGWVGALALAALSKSEDQKRALGYGYGGAPGPGFQLGPGFSRGHPGGWPGHPAQGFPMHGHPGVWPSNPAFGNPALGQPYGAVPPEFGHAGPATGFGHAPNPYGTAGDDSNPSDLPYGGFGSTPYGDPGGHSDDPFGQDPFGRDPFGREPFDDDPEDRSR